MVSRWSVDRVVYRHSGRVAQIGLVPQEVDLRDQGGTGKGTHHFRVTWPFWTRFMLKPTVGMELWPLALGPSVMMVLIVAQISAVGMLLSAQPEARFDALNSKLASLEDASSAGRVHRVFVDAARLLLDLGATHRQNPQQRCLAGIL